MMKTVLDDDTRLGIEEERVKANEAVREAIAKKDDIDHDPEAGLDAEAERLASAQEAKEQSDKINAYVEGETETEEGGPMDTTAPAGSDEAPPAKKAAAKKTTAKKTAAKRPAKKAAAKKTAAKK